VTGTPNERFGDRVVIVELRRVDRDRIKIGRFWKTDVRVDNVIGNMDVVWKHWDLKIINLNKRGNIGFLLRDKEDH
jgi:hypothetical protein